MAIARPALLSLALVLGAASAAAAAPQDCRKLIEQRESECQAIAEKRAGVCPDGQAAADGEKKAECIRLSDQLKSLCTRKPCGAAPSKKAKRKAKAKRGKSKAGATKAGTTKAGTTKASTTKRRSAKPVAKGN